MRDNHDNYYQSQTYNSSYNIEKFEKTDFYSDWQASESAHHSSHGSGSYSDSSYDSDHWSSSDWDSSSTDWDSDW